MSNNNQQSQGESQESVEARLAAINSAVDEKLATMPKFESVEEETAWLEKNMPAGGGCPIDPQERLLCDSCQ